MRALTLLPCLMLLSSMLHAQFGLNGSYTLHRAPRWALRTATGETISEPPGSGFSAGIDYWFRLKNARVEFLPELNYSQSATPLSTGLETDSRWYGLFFNVNLYPFDFKGDCDCPTFSKRGNVLQKGFFIAVSPGVGFTEHRIAGGWGGAAFDYKEHYAAFSIGVAAGLDFGISDLLTLSPYVRLRYFPRTGWESLSTVAESRGYRMPDAAGALQQLQAGMRLGLRID